MVQPPGRLFQTLATVGLLCALPAVAQVNIEARRTTSGQDTWQHRIGLHAALRAGSVDRRELALDLHSQRDRAPRTWLVLVDGELGWQDGRRYSNQGLLHLRLAQDLGTPSSNAEARPRLAIELFSQLDHARQRRLEARALVGLGLRCHLHRQLRVGSGLMLEREENDLPASTDGETRSGHREKTNHVRWTSYVSGHQSLGTGTFSFTAYLQPRLGRLEDSRFLADARLSAPLTSTVGLTMTMRARHDSRPVDGIDELDLRLSGGIALQL